MKTIIFKIMTTIITITSVGCAPSIILRNGDTIRPATIIKTNEPIAIMPFENENALSNLGALLSDDVISNILENVPTMKVIPATLVRNYLIGSTVSMSGLPDQHMIHHVKEGLKCRYLLTGNFYSSIGDVRYSRTYSNRIASGSVTVRLVDCDSLNVVWAKNIEASFSATSYFFDAGTPSSPYLTDGQLMQGLIKNLGQKIAELFY